MTHNSNSRQGTDRVLELIGAVAKRDANVEDIVAKLRSGGFDALDVMVGVLAAMEKDSPKRRRSLQRPIDVRDFAKQTPPERVAQIVHRAPLIPFILNGTLYDPKDINRFDRHELHFVLSAYGELVAFDNRNTIARVWEILYVSPPRLGPPDPVAASPHTVPQAVPQTVPYSPPGGPEGPAPQPVWPAVDKVGTYFYDDSGADGWGSELFLSPNRGYYDLTEVGHGFLGAGDWNDVISAYQCNRTNVVTLYEDIHYLGNTFTSTNGFSFKELNSVGWNDRASSLGTW